MPTNEAVAPARVGPGIRTHPIDIVQPPGIGISPVADMELHQTVVTATQTTNSIAKVPMKVRREACSETERGPVAIEMPDSKLLASNVGFFMILSPFSAARTCAHCPRRGPEVKPGRAVDQLSSSGRFVLANGEAHSNDIRNSARDCGNG